MDSLAEGSSFTTIDGLRVRFVRRSWWSNQRRTCRCGKGKATSIPDDRAQTLPALGRAGYGDGYRQIATAQRLETCCSEACRVEVLLIQPSHWSLWPRR